jgi:multisubunit Na+/H+ antiporter MnhB subunit
MSPIIGLFIAICGVAAAVCWFGTRHGARRRPLPSGSELAAWLVGATGAAFTATLGFAFLTDRPSHPGTGQGNIPIGGAVAVIVGIGVLLFLAVASLRRSRRPVRQYAS